MFLIIFESAAYVVNTPRPRQNFFEFYVLGANEMANNYYPNNSSFIQPHQPLTWYLGVGNQMGSFQFVDIRVKLGNQTIAPPNDTMATPSPAPLVAEFKQFVQNNGTWIIPFKWEILNFSSTPQGHTRIIQLQLGNATYSLQNSPTCSTLASCSFRFIFELWTWNVDLNDFQFGWWNGPQQQIAWLQIWFNLTPGAP